MHRENMFAVFSVFALINILEPYNLNIFINVAYHMSEYDACAYFN